MVTSMHKTMVMAARPTASPVAAECKVPIMRRAAELMRLGWRAYWRWRYREVTRRLLRSTDERRGGMLELILSAGDHRRGKVDHL